MDAKLLPEVVALLNVHHIVSYSFAWQVGHDDTNSGTQTPSTADDVKG